MVLLIPEKVDEELFDRSLLIQQQLRSDFGIGIYLPDDDALIKFISITEIWPEHCNIIDNQGGVSEIPEDGCGGALWNLSDKRNNSFLKMKLSLRFDLYCSKGFWSSINRFNQKLNPAETYNLWKDNKIDDYLCRAVDTGEAQLVPIFLRPYNPNFKTGNILDNIEISKDFPNPSEIYLQRLMGAEQTIIYSSRLSQICDQEYLRTRSIPHGFEADMPTLPRNFDTINLGQYATLFEEVNKLRNRAIDADFDYLFI